MSRKPPGFSRRNELEPLQQAFLEVNEILGEEVVRFERYSLSEEE